MSVAFNGIFIKTLLYMKQILIFLSLFFPTVLNAQTYKYIGVDDGLSDRRVYHIQKDKKGYMWFLTHEGVDRFNGKEIKHYELVDNGEQINSLQNLNWLYLDTHGCLWEIGKRGKIFKYNSLNDQFELVFKFPNEILQENPVPVTYSFIDTQNRIWLCGKDYFYLFDTGTEEVTRLENSLKESVYNMVQQDSTHFFLGTDNGIHYAELNDTVLGLVSGHKINNITVQVNELYYHRPSRKLFIGTFQRGVFIYDLTKNKCEQPSTSLADISINRFRLLDNDHVLVATDGAGVYKLNLSTYQSEPYVVPDYNQSNQVNGTSINDIYIDDRQRIWMANSLYGITIRDNRFNHYHWIKHSFGNDQSIVNDQVNAIIEDTDGDLWFATHNGISLYNTRTGSWRSFLSSFDHPRKTRNNVFLTLCEVSPGVIWAGGYNSGIQEINKKDGKITSLRQLDKDNGKIIADKYIRSIVKDSDGNIWSGGHYNLKKINYEDREVQLYGGICSITAIAERDDRTMWVGTSSGLYMVDKKSDQFIPLKLPVKAAYIHALYQAENGTLYIGTDGSGMLVYDPITESFTVFHKDNCALISNNVYSILSDGEKNLILGTENGLTRYYLENNDFHNWTNEQGLLTCHFNPNSGVLFQNKNFVVGSNNGAVMFDKNLQVPRNYASKLVFSDFRLFYNKVFPDNSNSPLEADIDETSVLKLNYDQNIFSFEVSAINYDYPSNVLFSWKLEGFYDEWTRPGNENIIRFTNLDSGKYTLRVRAVSNEDRRVILEERNMDIIVAVPFWRSVWAILFYCILALLVGVFIFRLILIRKQKNISEEKIRFFINTAHDIRTPLTLIKAPLEELKERENLSRNSQSNINTALRNVNTLLQLTTNLINFERADVYSKDLYISEYELNTFVKESMDSFRTYAEVRHIKLDFNSSFSYLPVWIDKEKMDSILKNLISNALKYTGEDGKVQVTTSQTGDTWSIEISDTGIGIPADEQKNLFKLHFRGSNAVNSKVSGSGIGLVLVNKLVKLHKGKITFHSVENKGSMVKLTFPKGHKQFDKAKVSKFVPHIFPKPEYEGLGEFYEKAKEKNGLAENRLLIVEDNDELRDYLHETLSRDYIVQTANDGKLAIDIVKEYKPDLIISDIMMSGMRGDEMCAILKRDIETSHIPVILLTALNDEKSILESLRTGADEYIVKPFNTGILKATIASILANRAILRDKYVSEEIENNPAPEEECINCNTNIDWKFISDVKKCVEDNMENPSFNVETLCSMLNMSRTSFYNKIKALTDQAPGDYVRIIRLNKAAQLLKEGKYNVTEVAEMTGFSDAKYFREVFKKHFKVSPSKYKE